MVTQITHGLSAQAKMWEAIIALRNVEDISSSGGNVNMLAFRLKRQTLTFHLDGTKHR